MDAKWHQYRKWRNLDFTGSKLNGIRFFGSEIRGCQFDDCQLQDFRVWTSRFSETSFRGASMQEAALGGVQDGQRNVFSDVDFSDADLSDSCYMAAGFERCMFRNTNLAKVDFQTSTFAECKFEGELREVIFNRRGFGGEAFPANEMMNVDLSRARLRFVEFRGLSLDQVRLPTDAEHIIIKNYTATLDQMIQALRFQNDTAAKKLTVFLASYRKWAAPGQFRGVLNIEDLKEIAGEDGAERVISLLHKFEGKTN